MPSDDGLRRKRLSEARRPPSNGIAENAAAESRSWTDPSARTRLPRFSGQIARRG